MTPSADPLLLQTLERLAAAERRLADAAERLAAVAPSAARLAGDTDWRTAAAVRFHTAAQEWQSDVLTLVDLTTVARDDVRLLGERAGMLAWGHLG